MRKSSYPQGFQTRITGRHFVLIAFLVTLAMVLLWNLFLGPLSRGLVDWNYSQGDTQALRWGAISVFVALVSLVSSALMLIRAYLQRPVAGAILQVGVVRTTIDSQDADGTTDHLLGEPTFWAFLRPAGHGNVARFIYLTGDQYRWLTKFPDQMHRFDPKHIASLDDVLLMSKTAYS